MKLDGDRASIASAETSAIASAAAALSAAALLGRRGTAADLDRHGAPTRSAR